MDAATLGVWLLSEYGYPWGNSVLVTLLHTLVIEMGISLEYKKEVKFKNGRRLKVMHQLIAPFVS